MRWVDRGPEPDQVEEYRQCYTQRWVEHYRKGMGQRDPDLINYWRDFRTELSVRFFGKCGYCEMRCNSAESPSKVPTVDHFRPLSKFPELAYEWSNWVFACSRCNGSKGDFWPESEYVDPCAIPLDERPETYFEVNDRTGEVITKSGLQDAGKSKAQNTIDDIGLNSLDLRYFRINWIRQFRAALAALPSPERQAFTEFIAGPEREFAGVTRMVAEQLRQAGDL